jgi:hypothetical protein
MLAALVMRKKCKSREGRGPKAAYIYFQQVSSRRECERNLPSAAAAAGNEKSGARFRLAASDSPETISFSK